MRSVVYLGCPASERPDTERALAAASVSVIWADNVAYALKELQRCEMPVLLDLSRGGAALQTARQLRAERASTLMFAVVDTRRPDLITEAVVAGVADVFARPLGGRSVACAIDRELGYESQAHADRVPDRNGDDLYSYSTAMRDVMTLVARAAAMRAGVMIRGEEGTGRQVVARVIHGSQPQDGGPFIALDCAAHDTTQLEAEIFGQAALPQHGDTARGLERVSRDGRLHAAKGGTLYLQNVADLSTRVQGRLARILRDREAVLVETGETIRLDVRPMASVDPGIDSIMQEGRVHEDLFRRLSVIRIDMPALRNRREDIPALANYFVRQICAGLRVPPKALLRPALSLIAALPWRGNAVELRTLLVGIVTNPACRHNIGLEDVLEHVRLDGGSVVFSNGGTLRQARARFEHDYIAGVLEQHHGRISDAAKALGIQRTNLYRKMRSLRVNRDRLH